MKKYIIKFLMLALLMYLPGCTSEFDEVNIDPNTITGGQLDETFAGPSFANALYKGIGHASWSLPNDDPGTYGLATGLHSLVFSHYMAPGSEGLSITDLNGINDGWRHRGWLRFYTLAVPSLLNAYKASEGNAEAIAILDIWKVYMFHRFTDHWGPIPYSQAGIGGDKVPYDSQESMYNDFFNLLETANQTLGATSESTLGIFQSYDVVYEGDIEKWRKFGNSLRLRLALRISDVNESKARTEAEAAVTAGVMELNDDNAYFKVSPDTYNGFVSIIGAWGFYMTADMESILKGYNDPRMAIWFSPVENEDSEYYQDYVGLPNGNKNVEDLNPAVNSSMINKEDTFAEATTKNIEILMASESNFNRAEGALKGWNMSGDAKTFYEDGIRLSLEQWGAGNGDIETYLVGTTTAVVPTHGNLYPDPTPPVDVPVAWASSQEEQLKQISIQKYLGLFPESWETWADLRRTDADILYPLLDTSDESIGYGIMKRITYIPNEYSTNRDAVEEAVKILGGEDKGSTNLWWDVD